MFSRNKASTTLSFVLSLIFFLYLTLIYKILQFPFEIQIIGGILLILTIIGYLLWRGMICKIKLPRSGIDFPIAIFLVSVFLSLVFSPNPESGLWRICCFLGLLIFFYGLIDLFNSGILDERAMMAAILVSNGFALFTAVNETVLWYQEWWQRSGSLWTLPIIPYRFTSILSHANVLIAYANLSLPLAVIFFLGTKNRRKKYYTEYG